MYVCVVYREICLCDFGCWLRSLGLGKSLGEKTIRRLELHKHGPKLCPQEEFLFSFLMQKPQLCL